MYKFILFTLIFCSFSINNTQLYSASALSSQQSVIQEVRHSAEKQPVTIIVFGATGDLASRKLFPALYHLSIDGALSPKFACVGFARREQSRDEFRKYVLHSSLEQFSRTKLESSLTNSFLEHLFYNTSEFDQDSGYKNLAQLLAKIDKDLGVKSKKIFYLATQPQFFQTIISKLTTHKLISKSDKNHATSSLVIIEKPFGHDLDSALALKKEIFSHLGQKQVLQIDHFLGKEGIQNLLNFRFSNPIFETLWSNKYIDHVEITIAEDIGIGTRAAFWEETGMLRDIIQNHMMQLVSLVAMERPKQFNAHSIQKEKIKLVKAIRPFPINNLGSSIIRGQYTQGESNGKVIEGYLREKNVAPSSVVETYVAAKLFIDNKRWKNVPFYIRAGKRMHCKKTEIIITFKQPQVSKSAKPNRLVIRIQPEEFMSLQINSKIPGFENNLGQFTMEFRPNGSVDSQAHGTHGKSKDAYEHLFKDAIDGQTAHFVNFDELLASWNLFSPVLSHWKKNGGNGKDLLEYPAGSYGPKTDSIFESKEQNWSD